MKKISLITLFLSVILLLTSCGGELPTDADALVTKMKEKGYSSQQTIGDDNIASYVEEYGLTLDDVYAIAHAQKENPEDTRVTMGTFLFCKDEATAANLKTTIENAFIEQFGAVNNPYYHNMTVEQKGNITFYGTQKIWEVANN